MAKTILEIAQEAADRENTCPRPTSLFNSNAREARIMLMAAKDTMRDIMRSTASAGLSELRSTWLIALQNGQFSYPLPPDFLRTIPNTEHRGGWPLGLIGPVSPQTWSAWLHSGQARVTSMGWTIKNGAIFFHPTPSADELVAIEYISRWMVVADVEEGMYDMEYPPNPVGDDIVPRDGHIEGDVSEVVYNSSDREFAYETAPGFDAAAWSAEFYDILQRINPLSAVTPRPQIRKEEFTADTDKAAFTDTHLLSLGITWRTRRALGKDYQDLANEYDTELDMMVGSDAGAGAPIRIGQRQTEVDVLPIGNGTWIVS